MCVGRRASFAPCAWFLPGTQTLANVHDSLSLCVSQHMIDMVEFYVLPLCLDLTSQSGDLSLGIGVGLASKGLVCGI